MTDVSRHYFKNNIKYQECSTDNYTGNIKQNKKACLAFISDIVNRITRQITTSYTVANYDSPDALAAYLQDKFATFST